MLRMPSTRKAAVSQRDVAIHELVCRRDRSLVSIGKQFGLTPQRVHQISKKMDSLLYKELAETVHLIKARQTATLRHVVDEAMAAWRDSMGQHEVIHERATKDGTYREVTKTQSAGNPAYLGTSMKALEDIHKVWGAESPKQVQVEAEVQVVSPQEQLIRIGQHMQQLMPEVVAEVVGGDM